MVRAVPIRPRGARIDTTLLNKNIADAMRDVTADGQTLAARYPAQTLRKSGYRRTGTLKRSWSSKVRTRPGSIEGTVGSNSNIAPYNRFVQGRRREQARIFRRTRWTTVDVLEKTMQDDLEERVEEILRKLP
jgi:hypothetical protein